MPVREKTTVHLDRQLLREAGKILGTSKLTDTIDTALHEVVRRERLQRVAENSIKLSREVGPENLERLRRRAWQRS